MEAIEMKYSKLEEDLLERRSRTQLQMNQFLEEIVGAQLDAIFKRRRAIEQRIGQSNKVKVIKYSITSPFGCCVLCVPDSSTKQVLVVLGLNFCYKKFYVRRKTALVIGRI